MAIIVILCLLMSTYVLSQWSAGEENIRLGMVLVSLLIHVAIPSFLAWALIYKKLTV
ncbi:hypothetical protein SDC9_20244 [bioreactor metagenome]|uniref:Uncharacterized protein n=1 Tax=bioreactor metagenome TaxID=1076179 RepID=A0A644U694_9ZZZZ